MQLTEHFTVEDVTQSHHGLDNSCPMELSKDLLETAEVCEEARAILSAHFGREIGLRMVYGFRCLKENEACGGSETSAHCAARAADVVPCGGVTCREAFDVLAAHPTFMLKIDQMITERGCLHFGRPVAAHGFIPRHELRLDMDVNGKRTYPLYGIWTSQGVQHA